MLDLAVFLTLTAVAAALLRWPAGAIVKRRGAAWAIAAVLSFVLVSIATYKISRSRSFQLFDHLVTAQPTTQKIVALTFDDGPTPELTPQILDTLQREGVRATFFLIGGAIEESPGAARLIAERGHEIGNHSFSHERMVFKRESWIAGEIKRTDALIRQSGYRGPILFRSPYAKRFVSLPYYLARHDRQNVLWDLEPDSDPSLPRNAERIAAEVVAKAKPGSIVLLHPMYGARNASRSAIPLIIRGLKARGYRFVTVSELLATRYNRGS